MKQILKEFLMKDKIVLKSTNSEVVNKVKVFSESLGLDFEVQSESSNVIHLPTQRATVEAQSAGSLVMADVEKEAILKAIESCRGNLTKAASSLKIGRATLYRKLEAYNIEKKAFKKAA